MIDILDIVIDPQISVGLVEPYHVQSVLSDLNRDGEVNVLDAQIGLSHLVGRISTLAACVPSS